MVPFERMPSLSPPPHSNYPLRHGGYSNLFCVSNTTLLCRALIETHPPLIDGFVNTALFLDGDETSVAFNLLENESPSHPKQNTAKCEPTVRSIAIEGKGESTPRVSNILFYSQATRIKNNIVTPKKHTVAHSFEVHRRGKYYSRSPSAHCKL